MALWRKSHERRKNIRLLLPIIIIIFILNMASFQNFYVWLSLAKMIEITKNCTRLCKKKTIKKTGTLPKFPNIL